LAILTTKAITPACARMSKPPIVYAISTPPVKAKIRPTQENKSPIAVAIM
jgi:hypothetical protein